MPESDIMYDRPLPNSPESERAVLGSIILNNGLITQAIELLKPDDFYVGSHRRIYEAMMTLFETGSEINPILLGEILRSNGGVESTGGVTFITNLTYGLPHFPSIAAYAKVIKDHSLLRKLIKANSKSTSEALEQAEKPEVILDRAEAAIFALAQHRVRTGFVHVKPITDEVLEKAQQAGQGEGLITGLASNFAEIDRITTGYQQSDLIIIAARPSMGKTSYALNVAENVAEDKSKVVAIFSMEMSKEALVIRMLCSQSRVDSHKFRAGFLNREEWARLANGLGALVDKRIYIDDTPNLTPLEIRAKSRRLAAEQKGLDLIIVDYLQLMTGGRRYESREKEVSAISRELKGLAKELNVPLIALSQLSRGPESRSDHRPQLADLRESGAIEQDADVVQFIYREEQYNRTDENQGKAEIITAKQRNGPTGSCELVFLKEFTRFENMFRDQDSPHSYSQPAYQDTGINDF